MNLEQEIGLNVIRGLFQETVVSYYQAKNVHREFYHLGRAAGLLASLRFFSPDQDEVKRFERIIDEMSTQKVNRENRQA